MATSDKRVQSVQKIIEQGDIRHATIASRLQQEGLDNVDVDAIAELVLRHAYHITPGRRGKLTRSLGRAGDKVGSYLSVIIGGAIVAEMKAAQILSQSLIADKLQGFGDHLRYWLGMKSIDVNGPEMVDAMTSVVSATPQIVKGMLIGAVVGYLVWKAGTRTIIFLYRRQKMQQEIQRLVTD